MSNPEIVVVFNPAARRAERTRLERLLKRYFSKRQIKVVEALDHRDTYKQLKPFLAAGVTMVVAAGGDGTISDVASALTHSETILGILPLGTGNVVAQGLKIPTRPDRAAQALAGSYDVRELDVLRVGKRSFIIAVSAGFSALTMIKTSRLNKRRFGPAAYWWTGIRNLFGLSQRKFMLEVDGERSTHRASEVLTANLGIIGNKALRWGVDVFPDDGRIEVYFVTGRSLWDYFRVLGSLLTRRIRREPRVHRLIARQRVVIRSPRGIHVQGDGDGIGRTPVEIELLPGSLKVAVPRNNPTWSPFSRTNA